MSKRCAICLRFGIRAVMGNERLNETLSMFIVIALN